MEQPLSLQPRTLSTIGVSIFMLASPVVCQGSTNTAWYDTNAGSFAKILAGAMFMGFLGLIFWKVWEMKKGVEKSREMLTQLEDQIDIIEEETDEFVVKSIKDIREGIIFFENPLRLRGYGDHNTKLQELHKKIAKLKKDVKQGEVDIADLKERNQEYKRQIKELGEEYQLRSTETYDIGHALGYRESLYVEHD